MAIMSAIAAAPAPGIGQTSDTILPPDAVVGEARLYEEYYYGTVACKNHCDKESGRPHAIMTPPEIVIGAFIPTATLGWSTEMAVSRSSIKSGLGN
jgi:hypothetical protein